MMTAGDTGLLAVIPEEEGTTLDEEKVIAGLHQALTNGEITFDLDAGDCYVKPEIMQDDAELKAKADAMIEEAQVQTTELVSEHEIMQQAYAQANEIVTAATAQAQQILDNATNDANDIRIGAVQYTDDLLANAESIIGHTLNSYTSKYDSLVTSLQECYDVVRNNRAELEVPDKSSRGLEAEFGGEAGQTDQGQRE